MRRDFLQRCRGSWHHRRGRRRDHSP
jgi:hypothetical protein